MRELTMRKGLEWFLVIIWDFVRVVMILFGFWVLMMTYVAGGTSDPIVVSTFAMVATCVLGQMELRRTIKISDKSRKRDRE